MNKLLMIAAGALLAACSYMPRMPDMPDIPGPSQWFNRENAVDVVEVRRAVACGTQGAEMRVTLMPDLGAVQAWESSRGLQLTAGGEPLPPGPYALVELGARNTGGYGLAVSRTAGRRGETLILKATLLSPGPNRMVTQMLTSPCVLVSLPQAHYAAVEVVDQTGLMRASTK